MPRIRAIIAALITASMVGLLASCDQQSLPPAPAPTPLPTATATSSTSFSLLPSEEPTKEIMPVPEATDETPEELPQPWPTLTYERSAEQTSVASLPTPAPPPPTNTPIPPTYTLTKEEQSAREVIKIAKEATYHLPSAPHQYDNVSGSDVISWPDQPDSVVSSYFVCGGVPPATIEGGHGYSIPCDLPMILTTEIITSSQGSGVDVIFSATWGGKTSTDSKHSWRYHVSDNKSVEFIHEEGDRLPEMGY